MPNKNPTVGQLESLIQKLQGERQKHVDAVAAIDESFGSLGLDVAGSKRKPGRPAKPKAGVKKRKGAKKTRRKKARKKSAQKPKRKGWTAAQKRAQSKMMKKRWAGKKKKKSAPAKKRRTKRKTKTKTKRGTKTKQKRKMKQTPALIAARKVQAQYMTRLRQLNSSDKAKVKAIVKKDGVKAALKVANEILKA